MKIKSIITGFLALILSSFVFAQDEDDYCIMDEHICEPCYWPYTSRASVHHVSFSGCVACLKFCPLGRAGPSSVNEDAIHKALESTDERIFIAENQALALDVATRNPSAGALLYLLSNYSLNPNVPLPSNGKFSSGYVHTYKSVAAVIYNENADKALGYASKLAEDGLRSITNYRLVKDEKGSYIDILHRVKRGDVNVEHHHPDIRVYVNWVPAKTGGYWELIKWSEVKTTEG